MFLSCLSLKECVTCCSGGQDAISDLNEQVHDARIKYDIAVYDLRRQCDSALNFAKRRRTIGSIKCFIATIYIYKSSVF